LIGGTQAALGLEDALARGSSVGASVQSQVRARDYSLPSRLTRDEEEAHRLFLADLGAPALWQAYERSN